MSISTDRPRIFSHLTRTRFLHIEDSLERRKLRFFIGSFLRGQGANATAFAFLDVDDARVIMNDLAWGKAIELNDYKGTKNGAGDVTARVLKMATKDQKVWIQIQNGPGEQLPNGGVKPQGKATAEISIALTIYEARKMGYACLAYLQAWDIRSLVLPAPLPE